MYEDVGRRQCQEAIDQGASTYDDPMASSQLKPEEPQPKRLNWKLITLCAIIGVPSRLS